MSDEKIDRIDRRVNELVNITGNLITAVTGLTTQVTGLTAQVTGLTAQVTGLTAQVKENTEQIKVHSEQINKLTESQQVMSGQLADVARIVIETSRQMRDLEEKVDEGFEEFGKESRVANRKIDWTANKSLDALTRVEDLESRVAQIEQKIAV